MTPLTSTSWQCAAALNDTQWTQLTPRVFESKPHAVTKQQTQQPLYRRSRHRDMRGIVFCFLFVSLNPSNERSVGSRGLRNGPPDQRHRRHQPHRRRRRDRTQRELSATNCDQQQVRFGMAVC